MARARQYGHRTFLSYRSLVRSIAFFAESADRNRLYVAPARFSLSLRPPIVPEIWFATAHRLTVPRSRIRADEPLELRCLSPYFSSISSNGSLKQLSLIRG